MINWVSVAWESIDPEIIVKSFLRCGISNSVDGSEDSLIWVEIPVTMNTDNEQDDNNDDDPFQDIDKINSFTDDDNYTLHTGRYCYATVLK